MIRKYGGFFLHSTVLPQCFGLRSREVRATKIKCQEMKRFLNKQSNLAFFGFEENLFLLTADQRTEGSGNEIYVILYPLACLRLRSGCKMTASKSYGFNAVRNCVIFLIIPL